MFCRECGAKLPDGAKFCIECGTKARIKKNTNETAKPVEEPKPVEQPKSVEQPKPVEQPKIMERPSAVEDPEIMEQPRGFEDPVRNESTSVAGDSAEKSGMSGRMIGLVAALCVAIVAGGIILGKNLKIKSDDKEDKQNSGIVSQDVSGIQNSTGDSKTGIDPGAPNVKIGDRVSFGSFINMGGNVDMDGLSGLSWYVCDIKDGNLFLISKDSLSTMTYSNDGSLDWADSNPRGWLNQAFYENAFTDEERQYILPTTLKFERQNEPDCQDYIFIPSVEEVSGYMDVYYVENYRTKDNTYFLRDAACQEWDDSLYMEYAYGSHPSEGYVNNGISYVNDLEEHSVCACMWVKNNSFIEVTRAPFNENDDVIKDLSYLKNASVGDRVSFGKYTQNDSSYEDIQWRVLDRDGDKVLLLSEYTLFPMYMSYVYGANITWETSSLRTYLNTRIKSQFFTTEEESILTPVINSEDEVFLLSVEEIQKYMPDEESRRVLPTKYCGTNGGFMEIDGVVYGAWWTRSFVEVDGEIGMIPIGANGFINTEGFGPTEDIGVRPAVWIDTSKIN